MATQNPFQTPQYPDATRQWWVDLRNQLLGPMGANYPRLGAQSLWNSFNANQRGFDTQQGYLARNSYPPYLQTNFPGYLASGQLSNLLLNSGHIDPAAMNQQLAAISRGTTANQGQVQGQLAQRGLQGSGLGQALSAAVGQAGVGQQAQVRAQESQDAIQRLTQILSGGGAYSTVYGQPQLDFSALGAGQYNAAANRQQAGQNEQNAQRMQLALALAAAICWAASEALSDDLEVDAVRRAVISDPVLLALYLAHGKQLAFEMRRSPSLMAEMEVAFHRLAEYGHGIQLS